MDDVLVVRWLCGGVDLSAWLTHLEEVGLVEREREKEREMRGGVHVWRSSGAVCVYYDDVLVCVEGLKIIMHESGESILQVPTHINGVSGSPLYLLYLSSSNHQRLLQRSSVQLLKVTATRMGADNGQLLSSRGSGAVVKANLHHHGPWKNTGDGCTKIRWK